MRVTHVTASTSTHLMYCLEAPALYLQHHPSSAPRSILATGPTSCQWSGAVAHHPLDRPGPCACLGWLVQQRLRCAGESGPVHGPGACMYRQGTNTVLFILHCEVLINEVTDVEKRLTQHPQHLTHSAGLAFNPHDLTVPKRTPFRHHQHTTHLNSTMVPCSSCASIALI
jgi:hypothetical protein